MASYKQPCVHCGEFIDRDARLCPKCNTEPYYILKGNGIFVDNDGSRTEIHPGDVCVIEVGQSHAIENPGGEPLEIMALVINERGNCE